MYSYVKKTNPSPKNDPVSSGGPISDQRPGAIAQRKLQEQINNSPQVMKSHAVQNSIDHSPAMVAQRQRNAALFGNVVQQKKEEEKPKQLKKDEEEKPRQLQKEDEGPRQLKKTGEEQSSATTGNHAGMPEQLKAGIEGLSGISMNDVKVHYNSSRPAQLKALAYAQGNDIHLGAGQEKHLPHEAWHVVQQRQGRVKPTVQMKGVQVNDDSGLEKEADVMGQKAMENNSGHPIQKKMSQGSTGTTVQLYTDVLKADQNSNNWKIGSDARVADNGQTVTSNQNRFVCFAIPWMIAFSNNILKAKGSGIELTEGAKKVKGPAPNGSGTNELSEVVPTIKISDSVSGTQNFWADCGRSSREVMGKSGTDTAPHGVYKNNAGKLQETASSKNPADFRDEILVKAGLGTTPSTARTAYLALSASEKEAFDKKHKINEYAAPEVGEAFVARRDDASTKKGFNFHWGGVIMTPGEDRVTLENFAKPGTNYDTKDEEWYFETYGPASKAGQTFHERNEGSVGEKGKNNITMSASTASLNGKTSEDTELMTTAHSTSVKIADLKKGTTFTIIDRFNFWAKIAVTNGGSSGKSGWIQKSAIGY